MSRKAFTRDPSDAKLAWPGGQSQRERWGNTGIRDGDPVAISLEDGSFTLAECHGDMAMFGDCGRKRRPSEDGVEYRELYDERVRNLIGKRFEAFNQLVDAVIEIRKTPTDDPSDMGRTVAGGAR